MEHFLRKPLYRVDEEMRAEDDEPKCEKCLGND